MPHQVLVNTWLALLLHASICVGCDRPHSRASRPTIQIVPVGADERISHTGQKYYLVDDRVGFKAVATDLEDGDLGVEILLRDEPYVPGTPITNEGSYAIKATCVDSDGNVETDFRIINIFKHARAESYVSLAEIKVAEIRVAAKVRSLSVWS